jgi:hypothetical protein
MKEGLARYPRYREATISDRRFRPRDVQVMAKTWDQIAAFVGHLDQRTTRRDIHFMPEDKRATVNSIPFEF